MTAPWLELARHDMPLLVSMPHTGTEIPPALEAHFVSGFGARKDADYWVHQLYDFAHELGATTLRTRICRSVIDVNRDPSGASLYAGQATTDLCPVTTFDGEPLYERGFAPDAAQITARRSEFFDPYHAQLTSELARLRARHPCVVLYDAHAIRSRIPRLFTGMLPELNLGTFDGKSCDLTLARELARVCEHSGRSWVRDGRFKGGWTTRHYGRPAAGVHAVQMELACRSYLLEPDSPDAANWPAPYEADRAAALRSTLRALLQQCLDFALSRTEPA